MKENKFYEDAARCGAWLGLAEVAFTALGAWKSSWLISLLHVVVFVTLLTLFTKRRAAQYATADEGYSYGKCLKFIFFMSLFAGVLAGAYAIVASNFLYPEKFHEAIDKVIVTLSSTGMYADSMLEQMKVLYEKMFFSPLWVVIVNVLSMILEGVFFGLFVSAVARREPQMFGQKNESDENELI